MAHLTEWERKQQKEISRLDQCVNRHWKWESKYKRQKGNLKGINDHFRGYPKGDPRKWSVPFASFLLHTAPHEFPRDTALWRRSCSLHTGDIFPALTDFPSRSFLNLIMCSSFLVLSCYSLTACCKNGVCTSEFFASSGSGHTWQ